MKCTIMFRLLKLLQRHHIFQPIPDLHALKQRDLASQGTRDDHKTPLSGLNL